MPGSEPVTFGARLRGYRIAAALSQEELAERSGLSTRGISDLERGARREPRMETVRMLGAALRLAPADLNRLLRAARPDAFGSPEPTEPATARAGPAPARAVGPARLPVPATTLIGREADLARAERLLAGGARLLTVTGPGGVGKTRLALEAGRRLETAGTPVALVELAAVRDAAEVAPAVLAAAGIVPGEGQAPLAAIAEATAGRDLVLLLDNLEQVAGVAPWVAALLAACPGVRTLATSRLPLRIGAERELSLAPLALPEPGAAAGTAAGAPAVALFVERAADRAGFELTEADAPAVVAICRRLDGLPLAIELAAAWTRLLPPAALLARLEARPLDLDGGWADAPARHQSLRETIAWSHDLLRPGEQALLRRLAVFAGGWGLEAAEAVADHDPAALPTMLALVERSFVRRRDRPDGTARYALLETIRAFALEQLAASGDDVAARAAHAAWALGLAHEAAGHLQEAEQAAWLARLRDERDNLQAALAWLLSRPDDAATALDLASTLWRFWHMQGNLGEGRRWLERAIRDAPDAPPRLRADALLKLGHVANGQGEFGEAGGLYRQCLELALETGDRVVEARALASLGLVHTELGEFEQGEHCLQEALALRQEAGEYRWVVGALDGMAWLRRSQRRYDEAVALLGECAALASQAEDQLTVAYTRFERAELELFRGEPLAAQAFSTAALADFRVFGDALSTAQAERQLAEAARALGFPDDAKDHLRRAFAEGVEVNDPVGAVQAVECAARLALDLDAAGRAGELLGAAAHQRSAGRRVALPQEQELAEEAAHAIRGRLGADAFLACWQRGAGWSLGDAVAAARSTLDDLDPPCPGD